MRLTERAFVLSTLILITNISSGDETVGPSGNRATGVVYADDRSGPFKSGEATIEIQGKESNFDQTDDDGVYYVRVPNEVSEYKLVYRADGYWPQVTQPIKNNRDPEKRGRVYLEKRDPLKLQGLSAHLKTETEIYERAQSIRTKTSIHRELKTFLGEMLKIGVDDNAIESTKFALQTLEKVGNDQEEEPQLAVLGSIYGKIVDDNGAPLPGVTVTANCRKGVIRTVTSGPTGSYFLQQLPPDVCTLDFSLAGFTMQTHEEVTIVANSSINISVALIARSDFE